MAKRELTPEEKEKKEKKDKSDTRLGCIIIVMILGASFGGAFGGASFAGAGFWLPVVVMPLIFMFIDNKEKQEKKKMIAEAEEKAQKTEMLRVAELAKQEQLCKEEALRLEQEDVAEKRRLTRELEVVREQTRQAARYEKTLQFLLDTRAQLRLMSNPDYMQRCLANIDNDLNDKWRRTKEIPCWDNEIAEEVSELMAALEAKGVGEDYSVKQLRRLFEQAKAAIASPNEAA